MSDQETILIADGEPLGRETLKALLMSQGYTLIFAGSGPETLKIVSEVQPDLLILAVMMPGIDGFEICTRVRNDPATAEMPIILVTSLDDGASRLRGSEIGVDDFITRPFDMFQLRARVRTITRLNRQRRQRAVELQAERDRTQAILEALGEAVIVTNVEGIIDYINPAAVDLTGFEREEVIGLAWDQLQLEETRRRLPAIFEAVRQGETWRGEIIGRRKDNVTFDVALTMAPLFDSGDQTGPIGFVSVQRDITPLKKAERAKNEFVSNVSHELRTPLSVITLVADNLDSFYARLPDQKRRKMINDIQKHSQSLEELIGDVLEISRIDSKRVSPEREELNLAQLVADEVEKLLPLAQERAHTLQLQAKEPVPIFGNDKQIRQSIRNLINNAIKYTLNGGEIRCECRWLQVDLAQDVDQLEAIWPGTAELTLGQWAAFRVVDNGVGIDQKHLPHLFDRFFRVKAQQNIRGTGLGLAITQEIIALHAGHITVASTLGQGSTFAFYLPLAEVT